MSIVEPQHTESSIHLSTPQCDIKLVREDGEGDDVQSISTKTKAKGIARDIIADMVRMNFSQDIKDRANLIHSRMTKKIRRTERRLQMIFYCIYSAHQEMKIAADPKIIAQQIGMPVRNITKALSTFSQSQTGYEPPNKFHTPADYIPSTCISLNIAEERIPEIIELSNRIVACDKSLCDEKPQKIALSIIDYWMRISGIVLDKATRVLLFGNTASSGDTISKRIQMADNIGDPIVFARYKGIATNDDKDASSKIVPNKITIVIKSKPQDQLSLSKPKVVTQTTESTFQQASPQKTQELAIVTTPQVPDG